MALHAVNMYITANLLLLLAAAGVACLRWVSGRLASPIAFRRQLRIAYALSVAAVLLPAVTLIPQRTELMPRNAQIWSAASMRDWSRSSENSHQIAISVASSELAAPLQIAGAMTAGLFLVGVVAFAAMLLVEAARIRRIIADGHAIARRRRVRVLSSQAVCVPFSFWLPGLHFIVLPSDLILRPADLRMAIRHEGQHHRQLDTRLTYAYQLLRALFFWNPAVHWLYKSVAELQEFSCDEALIAQRKVSAHAYCSCLIRVAESTLKQQRMSICAGMLGAAGPGILKNRIEAVLAGGSSAGRAPAAMAMSGAVLVLMLGTTVAFCATIQDRRITREVAQEMLATATERSEFLPLAPQRVLLAAVHPGDNFPLAVNRRVVEQLNLLLGTPDGRAFMRTSLQRMQEHEALIIGALARYGLPAELMAVPLVESGYRNLPHDGHSRHGAGLWMFIEPTAREFGLTVDAITDERLDVALETDAAMRMFDRLYKRFGDWGLALLAYNAGERLVEQAMHATGSRDVWQIVDRGYENDPDYVARVTAVLLIMKNPTALE
jgi:beta-lactamase regulating signal transducer with metallopeptidase domain